jgi:hypothetical protein
VLFSNLGRQKIQADFAGGTLTSDAGGLLLREVDRRLGLIDALADCLTDPRDPAKIRHDQRSMLAQRIFGIALGYEDLNDHDELRRDPLFSVLAEKRPRPEEPLASSPTLCRLENRVDRKALARISAVLVEQFIASFPSPPKELVLDFDPTDLPVHGEQERRFFHGFYDHYSYLPLYVFGGSRLLVAYLRPSNIDASLHSRAVLKLLVRRLRKTWPQVRIVLRADSAFARWRLLRWCEKNRVFYVVGLTRNPVLERLAAPFLQAAETEYQRTQQKVRHFYEFGYAAQTWDRSRRVIVKVERLPQGPNVRFVLTNLKMPPAVIYDQSYTPRGDMENRIKEQQLMLFADRASCHAFLANQFRLLLSAAAYVLIEHLRRTALKNTELQSAQADTIRLKLFKVAARVVTSVRRVVMHLSSAYPLQALFRHVVRRLRAPPRGAHPSLT